MLRYPCPYLVLVVNQIGTRLSENPRFFVLYSSAPPRLVSVHVLAAGHGVMVGGAELGIYCILFFCFRICILVLVILYFCILFFFCIFCHGVVVGGAEIGGRCCYWLVCPLGKQGLVK